MEENGNTGKATFPVGLGQPRAGPSVACYDAPLEPVPAAPDAPADPTRRLGGGIVAYHRVRCALAGIVGPAKRAGINGSVSW